MQPGGRVIFYSMDRSSTERQTSHNKTDNLSKMLDILKSLQSKRAEIEVSNKSDDSYEPSSPSHQMKLTTRIGPCRYCKKSGHWIEDCHDCKFNNQENNNDSGFSRNSRDISAKQSDVPQSTSSKTAASSSAKQENPVS